MCFRKRSSFLVSAALMGLTVPATLASAQLRIDPMPPVDVPRTEVALSLSINSIGTDVNAAPRCTALALPCTHAKAGSWGGFGLDGSAAVNLSDHAAFVAGIAVAATSFDSQASLARHRSDTNTILSVAAGPRIGSGFSRPHGRNHEADRFFGQVLAGLETSARFSTRPVVQVGGGVDSLGLFGRDARHLHEMSLRMEFDYRILIGGGNPENGYRFLLGVVLGPRLGDR